MASFDRTLTVKTSHYALWKALIPPATQQGEIAYQLPPILLVVQHPDFTIVYYLESLSKSTVNLRLVVTPQMDIAAKLKVAPDIPQALAELPGDPLPDSQWIEDHLREVTTQVEMAGQPSKKTPPPPFSLRAITLVTFFLSSVIGGVLIAENWRRIGKLQRFAPTLLLALGVFPFINSALIIFIGVATGGQLQQILLGSLIGAILGVLLILWQRPDYNQFKSVAGEVTTGMPCSMILAMIGAVIVLIFVYSLLSIVVASPVVTLAHAILPAHEFTDQGITLMYPGGWQGIVTFNDDFCKRPDIECLFATVPVTAFGSDLLVEVQRFKPLLLPYTLKTFSASLDIAFRAETPKPVETLQLAVQIDGHAALKREFAVGNQTRLFVFIEDNGSIIRLYAHGNTSQFSDYRQQVEAIISSLKLPNLASS